MSSRKRGRFNLVEWMSQGEEGRGAEKWKEERRLVFVESDEARNTRGRVERLYLVERMRRGGYDHNNYRYLGILDNKTVACIIACIESVKYTCIGSVG